MNVAELIINYDIGKRNRELYVYVILEFAIQCSIFFDTGIGLLEDYVNLFNHPLLFTLQV